MSVNINNIINKLEDLAPSSTAFEWDNVGLQIGSNKQRIAKTLLALDLTPNVVEEAIEKKVDMIITHHPLIFSPIKNIIKEDIIGRRIYSLIENNISLYVMHTNLDMAWGGTNDVLSNIINLQDIEAISPNEDNLGLGRIGIVPKTNIKKLSTYLKGKLNLENVKTVYDVDQTIQKVAICTGSGMSILDEVIREKADVFITGDVKFHDAQKAEYNKMGIIDVGHYGSENIMMPQIKKYLEKDFEN